ncbi:MAG: hypothetical protein Q7K47_01445 [Fusobacterium sp. JB019]|nr:hypothetical protein [Fusobacterium sp. JB019]
MKKIILFLLITSTSVFAKKTCIDQISVKFGTDLSSKYEYIGTQKYFTDETEGKSYDFSVEALKLIDDKFKVGLGISYQKHNNRKFYKYNPTLTTFGMEYDSIPIYGTLNYNINYKDLTLYLKANLGYSFNINSSDLRFNSLKLDSSSENGLYTAFGGGIEYNDFFVELMYGITRSKIKVKYNNKLFNFKESNDYKRVTLSVGYNFNI